MGLFGPVLFSFWLCSFSGKWMGLHGESQKAPIIPHLNHGFDSLQPRPVQRPPPTCYNDTSHCHQAVVNAAGANAAGVGVVGATVAGVVPAQACI